MYEYWIRPRICTFKLTEVNDMVRILVRTSEAHPAEVVLTLGALHVVAAAVLFYTDLALWTLNTNTTTSATLFCVGAAVYISL